MVNSIIQLNKINKIYGTTVKTQVLHDIDLEFEQNSFNSIIGQSGSGKSTLLNIIGTLDKPTSGEVYINQKRTDKMTKKGLATLRNAEIGFIFQFHYLLPEFSVLENVLMPYWIKKERKVPSEIFERANYLLDFVGLKEVKNNNAYAISGGQQQRTAIARALINNPKLILADEPTGNLDSDSTETVYELLRKLNEDFGTTFIVITHDSHVAERTDRIIEILDGRIKMDIRT
ncbi:ABC transporter ATP-binding protein [Candidatus Lokiarchaeum ossiferum]|uniref:ABC transporter ATP-binding protein n=1 Tax=Candidatus Lokiarchaeum ossiferum TaxID=2951803 RepID=UPI00352C777E